MDTNEDDFVKLNFCAKIALYLIDLYNKLALFMTYGVTDVVE